MAISFSESEVRSIHQTLEESADRLKKVISQMESLSSKFDEKDVSVLDPKWGHKVTGNTFRRRDEVLKVIKIVQNDLASLSKNNGELSEVVKDFVAKNRENTKDTLASLDSMKEK